MTTYTAPVRDMLFVLRDVLDLEAYADLPGFADISGDALDAVLEEGSRLATGVLHPLSRSGDIQGCTRHEDGRVTTPAGFQEAYRTFVEGGWQALAFDPEYGGQGLPCVLSIAVNEMFSSANLAFGMYPGLAMAAAQAIHTHGDAAQKRTYLPRIVSGEWGGTMNLTEAHCGTDLGLLRTRAAPQKDGTYKISGTKIFISAGEHDLTENIIHMVLARIDGAPEGVKGISLFIVPKIKTGEDGSAGEANGVSCGSIEEKMGIHANSTCVMNYDEATGYLVGEPHKGLRAMFTMMNEARLGVGLQGLAISEIAYQNAVAYARDRRQGRALTGAAEPAHPADPLLVHPDVRRMLMDQKAFNEGGRAWMYWAALQVDLENRSGNEEQSRKAAGYTGLMTPVLKAYLTDRAYYHTTNAQQVFGGHGYIREWGMEQFVRDVRITSIYEGANGVQALDLVGRKLLKDGGRAWQSFFAEIDRFISENGTDGDLRPFLDGLASAKSDALDATGWLAANAMKNPDHAGAASTDYLHLFAIVCLAYSWARLAKAAIAGRDAGSADDTFYTTKIATGRYFLDRILPDTKAHLAKIKAGSASMMALPGDAF